MVVLFTDPSEDVQRPPLAKHVLHIGIDGLRPDCMIDATSGLPNIIGRLAYNGAYTLTQGRTVLWLVQNLFHFCRRVGTPPIQFLSLSYSFCLTLRVGASRLGNPGSATAVWFCILVCRTENYIYVKHAFHIRLITIFATC